MVIFVKKILPIVLIGIGAGFLNGLLGAGGGIIIVMGLTLLLGKTIADPRAIYATAIAVVLVLSFLSLWQYAAGGFLEAEYLYVLIAPAVLGGTLGAWLLRRLSPTLLSRIFAALVLVSGIILVV